MISVRTIKRSDNQALASIIRSSLREHTDQLDGTVYYDPTTDDLSTLFEQKAKSCYFVVEEDGKIIGGAGLYPGEGMDDATVELVKMYLLPEGRGRGIGRQLMDICIDKAKQLGYKKIYIETLPVLKKAIELYEKYGYKYISCPIGNTGHTGCDVYMLLEIG